MDVSKRFRLGGPLRPAARKTRDRPSHAVQWIAAPLRPPRAAMKCRPPAARASSSLPGGRRGRQLQPLVGRRTRGYSSWDISRPAI
jgi:hypothetical protein